MKIKSKRPQAATARAFALACMCATGIMLPSHAGAGGPLTPLIQGYVQESVAGRSGDLDSLLFHRQTLHLEGSGDFSRRVSFRIEGDVLRDDADFQTGGAEIHSRLREAYVKFRFRDFDLRLGRMQVGWGEADGLIVSDQVSPLDLTYFIVPEFDEIRLGVDGATLDYYFSGGTEVQLLWIGKFTSPDFAVSASPWSFVDTDVFTALGLNITAPEEPATNISNSEFGLRISGHPAAADWSLGYLRSWDDRPSLRLSGTNLVPVHEMFDLITANLAWPVAKVMIRVDSAYEHGRLLSNTTAASTAVAGFVSRETLWRTLVGVDLSPNFEWWPQAERARLGYRYLAEDASRRAASDAEADPVRAHRASRLFARNLEATIKFERMDLEQLQKWHLPRAWQFDALENARQAPEPSP